MKIHRCLVCHHPSVTNNKCYLICVIFQTNPINRGRIMILARPAKWITLRCQMNSPLHGRIVQITIHLGHKWPLLANTRVSQNMLEWNHRNMRMSSPSVATLIPWYPIFASILNSAFAQWGMRIPLVDRFKSCLPPIKTMTRVTSVSLNSWA